MDKKTTFFNILKQEFSPNLRKVGFKGSGQYFRRIRKEVVNVLNIQVNRYGGSCAVNLGLHLAFLPMSSIDERPNLEKIKEYECEFRTRLSPNKKSDYWWKYDGFLGSPEKKARHLIDTYFKYGETLFSNFDSLEKIAAMFTIDDFERNDLLYVFGATTIQRGALTMARVHCHLGNNSKAKAFANLGLKNLGRATILQPQYEEILNSVSRGQNT